MIEDEQDWGGDYTVGLIRPDTGFSAFIRDCSSRLLLVLRLVFLFAVLLVMAVAYLPVLFLDWVTNYWVKL